MTIKELQRLLRDSGRYTGEIDGKYGPLTAGAVLLAMTDGPDTRLTVTDVSQSAHRLGVPVAHIKAVIAVESAGAGFSPDGLPVILFEPHRFARSTRHRFNKSNPRVSYSAWGAKPYPASQGGRYAQLLEAVGLDVDAGFASASYGKFQVLGENHADCGYASSFELAAAMARDERTQLRAFEGFINMRGLVAPLRAGNWPVFAKGYNGTGYRENRYDERLAEAAANA